MRRNNLDIYADILKVAKDGARKTKIVYKANLNFKIFKKHMNTLMKKGLLDTSDHYYFTTKQGINFLEYYQKFNRLTTIIYAGAS
jgi:predicted transcriptional regulator